MGNIGVGPYGFGTQVPDEMPARTTLGSSRQIGTGPEDMGQYVVKANGNVAFDTDVHQMVILALTTIKGSCADENLGRDPEPPDFGGNFLQTKRAQVENALAHIVKRGLLTIESIGVQQIGMGRSATVVKLFDRTTNEPFQVPL